MINIVMFGPPGAGKGTQAQKLAEKFNLYHISTGDVFRKNIKEQTELGVLAKKYIDDGKLVPDSVTIDMLKSVVKENSSSDGFIFDGFPRTWDQAEALDAFLKESKEKINLTFSIKVPDEELIRRILERGKDSGRADDQSEEVINKRIVEYNDKTAIVEDYYIKAEVLKTIDGTKNIDEVFESLSTHIQEII